jgi:hypothetical protein
MEGMDRPKRTPKTLLEAIEDGLRFPREESLTDQTVALCVADYLAQKFNAALLRPGIGNEEGQRLLDLFHEITGRK